MNVVYNGVCLSGLRGPQGSDGNPIGTVISLMGKNSPKDYVVCDGKEYDINGQYKDLAEFFKKEFDSYNYFGGDGINTFAVPDMRNLFLRGYHGESNEQLSGNIGKKQEATKHPRLFTYNEGTGSATITASVAKEKGYLMPTNPDTSLKQGMNSFVDTGKFTIKNIDNYVDTITSRPVNMAVLYCIKAIDTISTLEEYSTEDGWYVRKYNDGYVEQTLRKVEQIPTSAWTKNDEYSYSVGSPYFEAVALPVTLKEKYGEVYSTYAVNWSIFAAHRGLSVSDQKDPLAYIDSFALYRISSEITSTLTCTLTVIITGRWK